MILEWFDKLGTFMQWIQHRNKNEQAIAIHNHLINFTNIKLKKPDIKEYVLYDFVCIKSKNKQIF